MYKKSLKKFDSELAQKQNKQAQFEELSEKELDEVVGAFGLRLPDGSFLLDVDSDNGGAYVDDGYIPTPCQSTIVFVIESVEDGTIVNSSAYSYH
ncbi:MAG: hypothetical protein QNJ74_28295 [Trichodesmium sp. MO_231.B1]|nr:hypothetical protein [Trichodesmium sp. MO_231.B1]